MGSEMESEFDRKFDYAWNDEYSTKEIAKWAYLEWLRKGAEIARSMQCDHETCEHLWCDDKGNEIAEAIEQEAKKVGE